MQRSDRRARPRRPRPVPFALALLALVASACSTSPGASVGATEAPAVATIGPTASPTLAPTRPPQPTPAHPAPPELIGRWTAEPADGDVIRLELTDRGFKLSRYASANGRLEAFGDELVFSRSSLCMGEGRYHWELEADTLQLTAVSPDECPEREKSLDGIEFTRVR